MSAWFCISCTASQTSPHDRQDCRTAQAPTGSRLQVNSTDLGGGTALDEACKHAHDAVITLLKRKGARWAPVHAHPRKPPVFQMADSGNMRCLRQQQHRQHNTTTVNGLL